MANPIDSVKRFGGFLKDVRLELRKVTWPTRPDVVQTTGVVLVVTLIFAVFLYVVDIVLSKGVHHLFKLFQA